MPAAAGALGLALALTMALAPLAIRLCDRYGFWDLPGPRKLHDRPIPRLGGAAIWAAVCITALTDLGGAPSGLVAGGSVIFAAGAWEDVRGLSPMRRLGLQLAGAALAVWCGAGTGFWRGLPGGRAVECVLLVLWLAGSANAFNFLDGIDGEASALGVIAGAFMMTKSQHPDLKLAGAALAGACLGFLRFNWTPARAFLGDGGAAFIGFAAAALAAPYGILSAALLMGLPLGDLLLTTVTRLRSGAVRSFREWLEYAGRDHLHHRLLDAGFSVPGAVGVLAAAQVLLGFLSLAAR